MLDVTDENHIAALDQSLPEQLDAVVNNAGVVSQKIAGPPEKVARVVEEALTARHPRARYVVGLGPKLQLALITRLPTAVRDRVLRGVARQPG